MIAIMALVAGSASYAQTDEGEEKVRKHLIGVDIAPAVNLLTGGQNFRVNTSLQYQFKIKPKLTLRSSFNYSRRERLPFIYPSSGATISKIQNDTVYSFHNYYGWNQYDLRLGAHYNFEKKDINVFVGAEALIGLNERNHSKYYFEVAYDSLSQGYEYIAMTTSNEYYNTYTKSLELVAGINALVGLQWNFHPKWSLGAQFNFITSMRFGLQSTEIKYNGQEVITTETDLNYNYTSFDIRPLQIFLNYKF